NGSGRGGKQPTCPGCPSSFGSGGAPESKENVNFIYGIDRKNWFWQSQINESLPSGQNLTLPDPQNPSTLPVEARQGQNEKVPTQFWTFHLASIVSGWDDPAVNNGIAFLPVIPKGSTPQNQNFQVNLLLPCHQSGASGGDCAPNTDYKSTTKRAVATIAFTAPPTPSTGGNGTPTTSTGTPGGGSFVGSPVVGGGGSTTTTTTTTTGGTQSPP